MHEGPHKKPCGALLHDYRSFINLPDSFEQGYSIFSMVIPQLSLGDVDLLTHNVELVHGTQLPLRCSWFLVEFIPTHANVCAEENVAGDTSGIMDDSNQMLGWFRLTNGLTVRFWKHSIFLCYSRWRARSIPKVLWELLYLHQPQWWFATSPWVQEFFARGTDCRLVSGVSETLLWLENWTQVLWEFGLMFKYGKSILDFSFKSHVMDEWSSSCDPVKTDWWIAPCTSCKTTVLTFPQLFPQIRLVFVEVNPYWWEKTLLCSSF